MPRRSATSSSAGGITERGQEGQEPIRDLSLTPFFGPGEPFTVLGTVVEGMSVVDSLYSGYGENSGAGVPQGKQGPLETGGNAYMDREFPLLDRIIRVSVGP